MASNGFDEVFNGVHSGVEDSGLYNGSLTNVLEINSKRQISAGLDFDKVIAYEGDINSQIIVIKCVKAYDSHDLSACAHKELRWKNHASGVEGVSNLTVLDDSNEDYFLSTWEVPADVCTSAGSVEISLSLYDEKDEQIVFSWNTPGFSELSIGASMNSVSFSFPPRDEILSINKDTKAIIEPKGYNNTICNYGEIGVSEVYFLVNRFLGKGQKHDVMQSKVSVYVTMNSLFGRDDNSERITKQLYTADIADRNNEGLVFLTWKVPSGITAGPGGAKSLDITVTFEWEEDGIVVTKWCSGVYSKLNVGRSLVVDSTQEPEQWNLLEDLVSGMIEDALTNGNFVIDAN